VDQVTPEKTPSHARSAGAIQHASKNRSRLRSHLPLRAFAAILFWSLLVVPCLRAQQQKPNEFQVKAAYLYNFGRFVAWPGASAPEKGGSFEICVLGTDPFGQTLDATLASATIDGKSVMAKRISKPQDVGGCRIVFISSSEENHLKDDLSALEKTNVLTVSDIPGFSQRGGMIGFILDGSRVRFDVNLASAQGAGLTLSSELLKVAIDVKRSTHSGDL
jgi:hypothetical protein